MDALDTVWHLLNIFRILLTQECSEVELRILETPTLKKKFFFLQKLQFHSPLLDLDKNEMLFLRHTKCFIHDVTSTEPSMQLNVRGY